jgi:hypothetical protein
MTPVDLMTAELKDLVQLSTSGICYAVRGLVNTYCAPLCLCVRKVCACLRGSNAWNPQQARLGPMCPSGLSSHFLRACIQYNARTRIECTHEET